MPSSLKLMKVKTTIFKLMSQTQLYVAHIHTQTQIKNQKIFRKVQNLLQKKKQIKIEFKVIRK